MVGVITVSCKDLCARQPVLYITDFGGYENIDEKNVTAAANHFQHWQFRHPDYTKLASRVLLEEVYAACKYESFAQYISDHRDIDPRSYASDVSYLTDVQNFIRPERDLQLSFVAIKTLCRSYLLRSPDTDVVTEPPQYFFMRCAICVTGGRDVDRARRTYDAISTFAYIHSSATLFSACKDNRQYSSCYVMSLTEDNIFDKAPRIKNILLSGGGLGINISGCSPAGPYTGSNKRVAREQKGIGESVLGVLNATVNSVNPYNRKGSVAVYLDVWHPDVLEFIMAKMPHGSNTHAELFYGLNVNNRFMECVINNCQYHLIDPNACPELVRGYSEHLYDKAVGAGHAVKSINAREIMTYVIKAQSQSGVPYMVNIEAANAASNHRNIGPVPCSNLCTEIFQYHSDAETAVCNLASVNISRFVDASKHRDNGKSQHVFGDVDGCGCVDWSGVERTVRLAVVNINTLIDNGVYPDETCRKSNLKHRPMGVGVQGLFDAMQKLDLAPGDDCAREFNAAVAEHVYFYSLHMSADIAARHGNSYESFNGSDFSRGIMQFDYYTRPVYRHFIDPSRWKSLRIDIMKTGIYNSLLTAYMPTATVSGIFGTSEGVEPYITNVYTRSLMSGDITIINRNLVERLVEYGAYDAFAIDSIIARGGSVQHITALPERVKRVFLTAYEIDAARLRIMAADRGKFVDQGQSINMYIEPDKPGAAQNMIRAYVHMYGLQMKNYVYYVYGKAPGKPMDPTISRTCTDGLCCQ